MSSTSEPEIKKEEAPTAAVVAEPNLTGDPEEPKPTEEVNKAPEESKTPEEATTHLSNNGLRRNLNTNIREKIKEADPISATSIKPMLNIFGDRYDLNKTTDLKGTAQGLVSFVTNYGINPNYKMDIPLIIKAFYSVFPDGTGKPTAGFDEISKKPAYHLICNHIMYRMVTLKTEIQLQNRSSLRRGQLQDIYNRLDEFLQEGQCGRFSKAASEDAFRREQANKLLLRNEATGSLVATGTLEKKLQYIITILNQMIERGMQDRLKQLQVQGFDCGPMESLLGQLESDQGAMPVSEMIKAYTNLKISPGGLKICISRLRQQMAETNDLSKLVLILQSVKPGTNLTVEQLLDLISRLNKSCGKAAESVAADLKKEIGIPVTAPVATTAPSTTMPTTTAPPTTVPASSPAAPAVPVATPTTVPNMAEPVSEEKLNAEVEVEADEKWPSDDKAYYEDGNVVKRKFIRKEKGKPEREEIVDARIPAFISQKDDENFVLHKSGDRFTITNKSGVKGFIKIINGKYTFIPQVQIEEIKEEKQEEQSDTKDLGIRTVLIGGEIPDESGIYKKYNYKTINDAVEGLDIIGNKLVSDQNWNSIIIEQLDDSSGTFEPIKETEENTLKLWLTYKDGLTLGVPLNILLQPINQAAFSHFNKQLIRTTFIPTFDATIVDMSLPNSELTERSNMTSAIESALSYYISRIENKEGLVEVHNDLTKSGFMGFGSKKIHEQYALRLKNSLENANSGKIVPLPATNKDEAISNTFYFNIDLSEQPEEIQNSTFHMIVFVKNKKDLSGNTYVANQKVEGQEFMDGHFIRFIFGKDVESEEPIIPEANSDEPIIVPASTLGIETISEPTKTPVEVIKPNITNVAGEAVPSNSPSIITTEIVDEEPDLAIYYKTDSGILDLAVDNTHNILQIRKDNYNINDDGSVNFVFRNKLDGSIKKIVGPYKMKINETEYTIKYDSDAHKFYAEGFLMFGANNNSSLNGETEEISMEEPEGEVAAEEEPEPEPEVQPMAEEEAEVQPIAEEVAEEEAEVQPEANTASTPLPTESITGETIYNRSDSIWKMIEDQYNSTVAARGASSSAFNAATKDAWRRLYNYFNDKIKNKKYYYIVRHNIYMTERLFEDIDDPQVKDAFRTVMGNRIVSYQTLQAAIDSAKKIHRSDRDLITNFESLMGKKGQLQSKEITDSTLLNQEEQSKFSKILSYFIGMIPDSWLPTTRGGNGLRRTRKNKK